MLATTNRTGRVDNRSTRWRKVKSRVTKRLRSQRPTRTSQKAAVPRTNCHKAKPAQRLIRLLRNPDEPGMHCRVMPPEQASFDWVVVEASFSGVRTMHTYEKAPAQGQPTLKLHRFVGSD